MSGMSIYFLPEKYISITFFASLFAGNVINLFLYGALTLQLYLYYISFPRDRMLLKTIVYLIYATETVSTIALTYDLKISPPFHEYYEYPLISSIVIPLGGGIVAFLTQATYAYRLRILSQSKYVSWCIVAFIATNLVVVIVLTILASPAFVLTFVWPPSSLGIDATITGLMIWSLTKKKILSKQLKSKVAHLIYLIIGTGALTAAVNLVTVILFALKSPAAYGPAIVLSKLYANSVMVVLNDRIPSSHGCTGQAAAQMVTRSLGSIHFATVAGPVGTAQEQQALEYRDDAGSNTSGQMAVEEPSNNIATHKED